MSAGARRALAAAVLVVGLLLPSRSGAQVPFGEGTYERWSPLFDAPSGPLSASPAMLPEWISVVVRGPVAIVTTEPEGRVVWRIRYGAQGAEDKRVLVDGVEVLHAVYERDASGHLTRKRVTGRLAPRGLTYTYTTDAQGRVLSRERLIDTGLERLEVRWEPSGAAVATVTIAGSERRRDELDPAGRLRVTTFGRDVTQSAAGGRPRVRREEVSLVYERGADGSLREVRRVRGGRSALAEHGARDPSVRSAELSILARAPIERGEVRLLLGSPVTAVDRLRGASRELTDDFADGCWMNEISYVAYDATGLLESAGSGCICGFCVDASLAWSAQDVEGIELHWTTGPWLRLDGELIVTEEHEVLTPSGPRAAGSLVVGDVVTGSDGSSFALRTVERLPEELRLGRNVESRGGRFSVGRFVVVSERFPQSCTREHRLERIVPSGTSAAHPHDAHPRAALP